MSYQFPQITVLATAPARQLPGTVGQQQDMTFGLQSVSVSLSWGSAPATATIVFVGDTPVMEGSWVIFNIGINVFNGLCKSCVATTSTGGGHTFVLEFADLREYLTWDYVYCAFNVQDIRTADGVRLKRYKHLLPANFDSWLWTYTNSPLMGWEILQYIMQAKTVGTPWTWDLTDRGLFYEGVLSGPLIDVDFSNGRRLDAAINELCAKAGGVVYSLIPFTGRPYQLVFTRKGYLPINKPNLGLALPNWILDDLRQGYALSGNPTNIRILGDRNLYQVMEVPLIPDWAGAWQNFLVFEQFADYIYQNATDTNGNSPYYGTAFKSYPNDPEQYIGRQSAMAYAMEMTVGDFVAFMNATDPSGLGQAGNAYVDYRKFNGRARRLMPVKLYLDQIVFRAFKPNLPPCYTPLGVLVPNAFMNADGNPVPLDALNLSDKLLCRVDFDAGAGTMSFDTTQPVDSNGLAIVQGYNVVPEMLRMIQSDQFNLNWFVNSSAAWGMKGFQIDDSGEGNRFVIFDEQVVICDPSNPLVVKIGNHAVINAAAALTIPPAKAALTFLAEPYSYWKGTWPNVSHDYCEDVNGLNQEWVLGTDTNYYEIVYGDGQTADEQAETIATSLLNTQYFYWEGGATHRWAGEPLNAWGTQLTSLIDRVQYRVSPGEGLNEAIDLTREKRTDKFEPERQLDRNTVQNSLFPGQQELRAGAAIIRQNAMAIRQLPKPIRELFTKFLTGGLAAEGPVQTVWFKPGSGTQAPTGTLPAGSVIRRQPTIQNSGGQNINTVPDFAAVTSGGSTTDQRTVFLGVTTVHNVDATKPFQVQTGGPALAQVQGPVNVNDAIGLSDDGSNHLVTGSSMPQGTALEAITDTSVRLIKIRLGSGGGSGGDPVWLP